MFKHAKTQRLGKKTRILIIVGLVLVVLLAGIALSRHAKQGATTIPSSSSSAKRGSAVTSSSKSSTAKASAASTSAPDKSYSGAPITPGELTLDEAQSLVSNHKPGQNGTSTAEQSVCSTTPGATCQIRFSKGSLTKSLDAKTAGASGTVLWNWDVKDAGFSAGSWKISAVASLNGQTKTVNDATLLEIQP